MRQVCQFFFPVHSRKWVDSMLPCVCSVTDYRRCQNVVKTSVTHSLVACVLGFSAFCYHLWSITEQLHGGMEYIILFNRFPRDEECLAQVRCQTRHELNLSFGKNADGHKIVFFLKGNKGSWATKQHFHRNFLVNFKLILDFLLGWTVHWIIALILVKFKGS